MTDNTQPEALRLADELAQRWGENMACPELDAAAELRRQHARIAELEAQLEAIGAGGVSGPLMGEQSAPPPQAAPAGVLEDAARWHWMAEYIVGTRTDLDDELIASATVDELRKMVDADLAARKQGASHD